GAGAVVYDASHCIRGLVDGGVGAGIYGVVWGLFGRSAFATGGIADTVCGLCGVAARVAAGGGAGEAIGILEAATGGRTRSGTSNGPGAAGGAELPGSHRECGNKPGLVGGVKRVEPAPGGDTVHDPVSGLQGIAEPIQRAEGHR